MDNVVGLTVTQATAIDRKICTSIKKPWNVPENNTASSFFDTSAKLCTRSKKPTQVFNRQKTKPHKSYDKRAARAAV